MPTTTLNDLGLSFSAIFRNLLDNTVSFLPTLFFALVALVIGWIIAVAIGRLVTQVMRAFRVDHAVEKIGFKKAVQGAGYKFDVAQIIGGIVRWFIIIAAVLTTADILQLDRVSSFLNDVLFYIPSIIVAIVVLLVGVVLASFLANLVRGSVRVAGFSSSDFLAAMTKWTILIFSFLVALNQLGVAANIINTLITGFVAMLALAGGLAFGLGGKDLASEFLRKLKKEITEN